MNALVDREGKITIPGKQILMVAAILGACGALFTTGTGLYWKHALVQRVDDRIDLKNKSLSNKLDIVILNTEQVKESVSKLDSNITLSNRVSYKMNPRAYTNAKAEIEEEDKATRGRR